MTKKTINTFIFRLIKRFTVKKKKKDLVPKTREQDQKYLLGTALWTPHTGYITFMWGESTLTSEGAVSQHL